MLAEMAELARGGGYRWDGTYEWRSDAAGRRITTFTYNFAPTEGANFAAFSRQREVVQGDVGIPDLEVALAAAAAAGPLNAAAIEQTAGVVGTKVGGGQCSDFGASVASGTRAQPPTWDGPPSGTNARWYPFSTCIVNFPLFLCAFPTINVAIGEGRGGSAGSSRSG